VVVVVVVAVAAAAAPAVGAATGVTPTPCLLPHVHHCPTSLISACVGPANRICNLRAASLSTGKCANTGNGAISLLDIYTNLALALMRGRYRTIIPGFGSKASSVMLMRGKEVGKEVDEGEEEGEEKDALLELVLEPALLVSLGVAVVVVTSPSLTPSSESLVASTTSASSS
jgi:hypothetical protein